MTQLAASKSKASPKTQAKSKSAVAKGQGSSGNSTGGYAAGLKGVVGPRPKPVTDPGQQPKQGPGAKAIEAVAGLWIGKQGEKYEVKEDWRCIKTETWGESRSYVLTWSQNLGAILWGEKFFLDAADVVPGRPALWYRTSDGPSKRKEAFTWNRPGASRPEAGDPSRRPQNSGAPPPRSATGATPLLYHTKSVAGSGQQHAESPSPNPPKGGSSQRASSATPTFTTASASRPAPAPLPKPMLPGGYPGSGSPDVLIQRIAGGPLKPGTTFKVKHVDGTGRALLVPCSAGDFDADEASDNDTDDQAPVSSSSHPADVSGMWDRAVGSKPQSGPGLEALHLLTGLWGGPKEETYRVSPNSWNIECTETSGDKQNIDLAWDEARGLLLWGSALALDPGDLEDDDFLAPWYRQEDTKKNRVPALQWTRYDEEGEQ